MRLLHSKAQWFMIPNMEKETLFTKICAGIIPSTKLYEDDVCFVIMDINPVVKGHSLVISKVPYSNVKECPENVLSHMINVAKKLDSKLRESLGCDGSNILINNDPASGQEVPHLHIHVIPRYNNDGKKFGLSHDSYKEGEMAEFGKKLAF